MKKIDSSNFYLGTVADWGRCELPERLPDYVSFSGSAYWFDRYHVKRMSDHWGSVASCYWLLEGNRVQKLLLCGECPFSEFRKFKV